MKCIKKITEQQQKIKELEKEIDRLKQEIDLHKDELDNVVELQQMLDNSKKEIISTRKAIKEEREKADLIILTIANERDTLKKKVEEQVQHIRELEGFCAENKLYKKEFVKWRKDFDLDKTKLEKK